jgi:hypothetical protein
MYSPARGTKDRGLEVSHALGEGLKTDSHGQAHLSPTVLDWPFSTTSTTSNLRGDENEFGFVHLPLLLLIDQAQ